MAVEDLAAAPRAPAPQPAPDGAAAGVQGLILRGDGVIQILPQMAVLLAYAAGLIGLAVWRFRRLFLGGSL